MAALAGPLALRASRRRLLVRLVAWHPEWWLYAVAGAAGVLLVLQAVGAVVTAPATGHAAAGSSFAASWSAAWGHWALMVAAMMLPVVAPQVRNVAMRSVWSRRHRGAAEFVAGYVAVWLAAGAALVTLLVALGAPGHGSHLSAVVLLVAAAWQVSRPRRRVLRRCAALRLGAATGVAADLDCARAGMRSGLRCLVTCWPAMVAMAFSHSLLLMSGLLLVLLSERARGPDPVRRAGRPLEAWVLGGFAAVAAAVATVG